MKRFKSLPLVLIAAIALIVCVLLSAAAITMGTGKAYAYGAYDFQFEAFKVTYDVRTDRTMDVTMDLTVRYLGYDSTGFIHDIPVNAGDRVRGVKAYELIDGKETHLDYKLEHDLQDFVSVNMGDYSKKTNQTHIYRVKYEYAMTKPADKNVLYLNAIGYGSEAAMKNIEITYNLPEGLQNAVYYTGRAFENKNDPHYDFETSSDGKQITLKLDALKSYQGVTFAFTYGDGVLSVKPDLTPYWIIIVGCIVLALLFAVKFLKYNKDGLTPVVSVEPPQGMCPLTMGKLIDNKVDNSDVTSLIFYWANKGYLKINLENENDIELIQIVQKLPHNAPGYQKIMYDRLFSGGEICRIKDLSNSFYTTVETVTKRVNAENSKLYEKKSMTAAIIFALLGALIMAVTPILLPMFQIGFTYFSIIPLFMIVPSFIVFAVAQSVKYNLLKNTRKKSMLLYAVTALISAAFTLVYVLFVPSYVIETLPKILLCVLGFSIIILSTLMLSRTEEYREKLNHIVGFKQFITYTEKDKLEMMLQENPEFYYQVLPYAIVLGVSDIWADKFKDLTVVPPHWTTNTYHDRMFNFMVFNSALRHVNRNMATTFVSRPSSASHSGGGSHGGHFGGFSGGGHGGGGFRGR